MKIKTEEEILKTFSSDSLIQEAETLEACGGYLHMSLMGYSADKLREMAEKIKREDR